MAKMKKTQKVASDEQAKNDGRNPQPAEDPKAPEGAETPLNAKEEKQLRRCEETIESGLKSFFEVGDAIRTINEERLYRGQEYSSFDVYCSERWSMSGSHARRLIDAADLMDKLRKEFSPKGESDELLPQSENHVRPLVRLKDEPEQQIKAWAKALEKSKTEKKRLTGQMVDAIVDKMLGKKAQPKLQSNEAQEGSEEEENSIASDVLDRIADAKKQLDKGQTKKVAEYLAQIEQLIREHFGLSD